MVNNSTISYQSQNEDLDGFYQYRITLALLYKFLGLASMLGSTYVIYSIVGKKYRSRENLKTTYNRLLIALSVADILSSFALFLSTWPIPKNPPISDYNETALSTGEMSDTLSRWMANYSSLWNKLFPYSSGTIGSCNFQGFILQLGQLSSVLFTGSIALQYVFAVRLRWREKKMKTAERVFFSIGIILPLITAIAATATGHMNASTSFCWINPSPWYCQYSYEESTLGDWEKKLEVSEDYKEELEQVWMPNKKETCSTYRGESWLIFRLLGATIWIAIVALIVIVSMILLYMTVRKQEKMSSRWVTASSQQQNKRQILVVKKGLKFIGAYLVVWIPVTLTFFVRFKNVRNDTIVAIFLPMQGILNALIQSNARQVLTKLICRCCCKRDTTNETQVSGSRYRFSKRRSTQDTEQQPSSISMSNKVNDVADDSAEVVEDGIQG